MSGQPRVFISYSHDSEAHRVRVRALANRLNDCGIDTTIDQYEDFPEERWPAWCKQQIAKADHVLLVCTETYRRRVDGEEADGIGLGVCWEASIIQSLLYDAAGRGRKFVPVLFADGSNEHIPLEARGFSRFVVDEGRGFEDLCRFLLKKPRHIKPTGGTAPELPPEERPWVAEAAFALRRTDDPPAVPATIPAAYVDWLRRDCAGVDLLGQAIETGISIELSHVYVPALTRPPAPSKAARKRAQKPDTEEKQATIPLLRRLDRETLYVPAPAGAGKSTFCRWAVLQSLDGLATKHRVRAPKGFAESVPKRLRGRLPVLVRLRDFAARMPCSRGLGAWRRADLERALSDWIDAARPDGLSGALLIAHLRAGSAFLLLDGLDEVPVSRPGGEAYPRELLVSGLADALPAWLKAGNRIILTSRPYGLEEAGLHRLGLPEAPLEPLPEELQDLFVRRWFHTLGKPGKAQDLIPILRDREMLAPLVENPLLLTALCVLYDSGGRLPEDRRELYDRIVSNVLFHRFPGDTRQRETIRARLEVIALGMHAGEADAPRSSPAAEISLLEVDRILREFSAEDSCGEDARVEPAARREELIARSGLLLPQPNAHASFYHLSFQEFLAAECILRTDDDLFPVFRERARVAEWRPALLFLFAGQVAHKRWSWGSALLQRLIEDQDREAVKANPAPAVFLAEAIEWFLAKQYPVDALAERFRQLALDAIEDEVELKARQAIGLCLGRLGDPRILSLRDAAAYVEVPVGSYRFSKDGSQQVEITQPFRIGRYPVTNSQYADFITDGGYRERGRQWWSEDGWAWLQDETVTEPLYWHDRRWNAPNQPVVGVSFWEAQACAAWAGGGLPTEEEWEAAARGPTGLKYPWGKDWADGICNTREAGLGMTSPVGLFPRARQAELGIEDLAGNVWEWCNSLYGPAEKEKLNASRVLRGGSWYYAQDFARSAFRFGDLPDVRDDLIGFRVVCLSPIFGH